MKTFEYSDALSIEVDDDGVAKLIFEDTPCDLDAFLTSADSGGIAIIKLDDAQMDWVKAQIPMIGGERSRQAGHSLKPGDKIVCPVSVRKDGETGVIMFHQHDLTDQMNAKKASNKSVLKIVMPPHRYATTYPVALPTKLTTVDEATGAEKQIHIKGVVAMCVTHITPDTVMFEVTKVRHSSVYVKALVGDPAKHLFTKYEFVEEELNEPDMLDDPEELADEEVAVEA